ncbi:MAG: hypothetical protein ABW221_20200 [Vicinamibacteria bacterium]
MLTAALLATVLLAPLDRQALVTRHFPVVRGVDPDAPLTVGNGRFAFTADVTGLQTLADHYHRHGVPTETLARWAWHSEPNPRGFALADAGRPFVEADGRTVAYPTDGGSDAGQWLRRNPHDLPLGQLAFEAPGAPLGPGDIRDAHQTLDLWRGVVDSRFALGGVPVRVTTAAHPDLDLVAVRVESALLASGRLRVRLRFPRGHDRAVKNTPALDWTASAAHVTAIVARTAHRVDLLRTVDDARHHVAVAWTGDAAFAETAPHRFTLAARKRALGFVVAFAPDALPQALPTVDETLAASARGWKAFWRSGAAVDFAGSRDPRAAVLERRVVLSQYLTAVQVGGDFPPQESGLTCSTWYGKHHTEMMWWHTAHFALWGRPERLARLLDWYTRTLPVARAIAGERGLRGARWPKMVGPQGRESPGGNPLIVWNQPHPIALAELVYRADPSPATLARYRDLVFETADGLASMTHLDPARGEYVLGPPLWIAQEIYDQKTSRNPSFELSYWRTALATAQAWRERLGLPREPGWDDVIARLSPLPAKDGRYVALESHPDTFDTVDSRHDHPTMLAPLGLLPGAGVDRATMERTLDAVLATWDWETKIWGWDYPMIAMTAARLGRPETAVEILLRDGPNNRYLPNGHCPQRSDEAAVKDPAPGARKREIAVYLPANGALLSAVALMVAGWDGAQGAQPGFPRDGSWTIRAEGLRPLP